MAKVIHVISSSGLYGAERSLLGLIKSVTSYDHHVVCFDKQSGEHIPFVNALSAIDIPVMVLKDGYGAIRSNAKTIAKLVPVNQPPCVHAHGYKGTMTSSYVKSFAPETKILCTQHGFTNKSFKSRTFSRLETVLVKSRRVDHVICVSNAIRSFYLNKGISADKLTYVANAVNIPTGPAHSTTEDSREIDFLYLGRLSIEKGPDVLLNALAAAKAVGLKAQCSIAGNGPLMEELREQAERLGLLSNINFLGFVDDPADLLKRTRWLVMPSRTEGLPMSALEAMSYRTPLIASAVGELPAVIDGDTSGILVPPDDITALSNALLKAAKISPATWMNKSQSAFETVSEHYGLTRYGREIANIYDRVFAPKASPAHISEARLANTE